MGKLVLSRRAQEKIVLPDIATSIQIVSIKSGVVRLGIEAPSAVAVYREEVLGQGSSTLTDRERERRHTLRNRLSAARVGLALLREQLKANLVPHAEETLALIETEFESLQATLDPPRPLPTSPKRLARALLVEDDSNERELLAGFLRLAGLSVDAVADGCDALEYLRQHDRPDVMLLDMVLPRCDGATTLRAIRQDPQLQTLKVLAVSGHDPADFAALDASVDRWFRKPLDPQRLLRELQELAAA